MELGVDQAGGEAEQRADEEAIVDDVIDDLINYAVTIQDHEESIVGPVLDVNEEALDDDNMVARINDVIIEVNKETIVDDRVKPTNDPVIHGAEEVDTVAVIHSANDNENAKGKRKLVSVSTIGRNVGRSKQSSVENLSSINFQSKTRPVGRPAGKTVTAIWLPLSSVRKCSQSSPKKRPIEDELTEWNEDKKIKSSQQFKKNLAFNDLSKHEKTLRALSWILPDRLVHKILNNQVVIDAILLNEHSDSELPDQMATININVLEKYFDEPAFRIFNNKINFKKVNGPWTCKQCNKTLDDESICCDSCMCWCDIKCANIEEIPTGEWFCSECTE